MNMVCPKAGGFISAVLVLLSLPCVVFADPKDSETRAEMDRPSPVAVARATDIPDCTLFVDAMTGKDGDGSVENPHATIAAAVAAAPSAAIICVAEGTYAEEIKPGEKAFTLAGGFQSGSGFKQRDSAAYVAKAVGKGGSFLRIEDPGPKSALSAIDGFDISGFSQAIYRDFYESQRFDITNNHIHDNVCADPSLAGAGFALNNVSGSIKGNVIADNSCGRGGAGFLNDTTNQNTVSIESNRIERNSGTEPDSAHGGALYLFGNTLKVAGNAFIDNTVTQWGRGPLCGRLHAGQPANQGDARLECLSAIAQGMAAAVSSATMARPAKATTRSTTETAAATFLSTAARMAQGPRSLSSTI